MSDFWLDFSSTSILHVCEQRRLWAVARLQWCAGLPEPSLVACVISSIISWAGSFVTFWNWTESWSERGRKNKPNHEMPLNINLSQQNTAVTMSDLSFNIPRSYWAASSEFVSSSILSWQILTVHAQPFSCAINGRSHVGLQLFCLYANMAKIRAFCDNFLLFHWSCIN